MSATNGTKLRGARTPGKARAKARRSIDIAPDVRSDLEGAIQYIVARPRDAQKVAKACERAADAAHVLAGRLEDGAPVEQQQAALRKLLAAVPHVPPLVRTPDPQLSGNAWTIAFLRALAATLHQAAQDHGLSRTKPRDDTSAVIAIMAEVLDVHEDVAAAVAGELGVLNVTGAALRMARARSRARHRTRTNLVG